MAKKMLSRDGRGTFQRDLGFKQNDKGDWIQHRFYLGKDYSKARLRCVQLEAVWEVVVKRWQRANETDRPSWDHISLAIGQAVARGDQDCLLDVHELFQGRLLLEQDGEWKISGHMERHDGKALLAWLNDLQTDFPMIPLRLGGPFAEKLEEGREKAEKDAAFWRNMAERDEALVSQPTATSQTLHQALDAFSEYLKQKYKAPGEDRLTLYGETLLRQVKSVKEGARNVTLSAFDLRAIDEMISHWATRPMTKRGNVCSVRYAGHVVKLIRAFVKWLHRSTDFDWRKPADYEVEPVRIRRTQNEVAKLSPAQVQTWALEELSVLWQYAFPMDRLYFLLALNCGFGIAEISGLQQGEIVLGEADSYIKRVRYKSQVYGEWKLWPLTVQAIRWMQAARPPSSLPQLILNRKGNPLSLPTSGNRPNRTIPNSWHRLLKKVRKDYPLFRMLSFNKLRKTAGNEIRKLAGGEVASVFLSHGQAVSDSLLEIYTNRDFSKVFKAIDAFDQTLQPFLSTVAEPFPRVKPQPKITLGTMRRIKDMKAGGYKVAHIAQQLGVSRETVRRHTT